MIPLDVYVSKHPAHTADQYVYDCGKGMQQGPCRGAGPSCGGTTSTVGIVGGTCGCGISSAGVAGVDVLARAAIKVVLVCVGWCCVRCHTGIDWCV